MGGSSIAPIDAGQKRNESDDDPSALVLSRALASKADAVKVTGPAGSGKTEFLVRSAARLVEAGVDPARICMVVLTFDAVAAVRSRLLAIAPGAHAVRVTTPFEEALRVLGAPAARAFTDRRPRVLFEAERTMLLEDLKLVFPDPRTLRGGLTRLLSQRCALKPRESWDLREGDAELFEALTARLKTLDALLREEVAPCAADFLASDAGGSLRKAYDAVLVDDFQNLSAGSQRVCELLCGGHLYVTGDENEAQAGFDPYPSAAGFLSFEERFPEADSFELTDSTGLPPRITAFGAALCRQQGMMLRPGEGRALDNAGAEDESLVAIKWREPTDEFAGVVSIVRSLLDEDRDRDASEVYVAVPNRMWAERIDALLKRYRVKTSVALDGDPVRGDPRTLERAGLIVPYARLALAADSDDAVAWRLWCGLGHRRVRAEEWARLESWAHERSISLVEALSRLGDAPAEPFEGASQLRERFDAGAQLAESLRGKRGFSLAKAVVGGYDAGFSALLEPLSGDEDARTLLARAHRRMAMPFFDPNPHRVRIGTLQRLQGLNPQFVVMTGLVDGLVPAGSHAERGPRADDTVRERALRRLAAQRRMFYSAAGKARVRLILSSVQRAEVELAERYGIDVRRTRIERGRVVAQLARSCFLDEAGDATPSTVSGEQYLGLE